MFLRFRLHIIEREFLLDIPSLPCGKLTVVFVFMGHFTLMQLCGYSDTGAYDEQLPTLGLSVLS